MNDTIPVVPRSRGRLVLSALVTGAAFAVGLKTVDPSHASRVLGILAGITAMGAGATQLLGEISPRWQRWALYALGTGLAGSFGVLARMLVHVFSLSV